MANAEPHSDWLEIGDTLGDYKIVDQLGSGAMATLYRVVRQHDGKVFAAKVMRPELIDSAFLREKFMVEAQVLRRLSHPNIVPLVDTFQREDLQLIFVMDFIDGSTLEAYLPLHPGGLSEVLTIAVGLQIVDAVTYAHSQGVVHRDLKPENILLQQTPIGDLRAFVADFGLAKAMESRLKTATGLRLGTLAYMAPEQIQDSSRVDARADVYALGVTLFECLTGRLPFPVRSLRELIDAQLHAPIPSVRHQRVDLDPTWDEIIRRACAKDRDDRYDSAAAMFDALLHLARRLSLDDRTTQALPPLRRPSPPALSNPTSLGVGARAQVMVESLHDAPAMASPEDTRPTTQSAALRATQPALDKVDLGDLLTVEERVIAVSQALPQALAEHPRRDEHLIHPPDGRALSPSHLDQEVPDTADLPSVAVDIDFEADALSAPSDHHVDVVIADTVPSEAPVPPPASPLEDGPAPASPHEPVPMPDDMTQGDVEAIPVSVEQHRADALALVGQDTTSSRALGMLSVVAGVVLVVLVLILVFVLL